MVKYNMDKNELVPKTEANYKIDGGDTPCSSCKNFIPPNACKLVSGVIAENGTCDFFEAKDSSNPADMMSMLFGGQGGQPTA